LYAGADGWPVVAGGVALAACLAAAWLAAARAVAASAIKVGASTCALTATDALTELGWIIAAFSCAACGWPPPASE
jgi:hypothetical protein